MKAALPSPHGSWLLLGDEGSFYSQADLRRLARRYHADLPADCWTSSPRVEIGDVLFIYYMAPRQAIHFVCRATSRPHVNRALFPHAYREVSKYQWWVDISPPIEIEPIPFREISLAMGGYLNLKGRAGKYVDAAAANRLMAGIRVKYAPSATLSKLALARISGRPDLPDPGTLAFPEWREIPSAALKGEREVEVFIVEPLLRFCGIPRPSIEARRQVSTPKGIPDYVIGSDTQDLAVVEVKQRVAGPRAGIKRWAHLPDYEQLCRYMRHFGCKGMLADCDQIFLFDGPRTKLVNKYDRRSMTKSDLREIGRFLLSRQLSGHDASRKASGPGKSRTRRTVVPSPPKSERPKRQKREQPDLDGKRTRSRITVSEELAKIVGPGNHTPVSLTRKLWKYIFEQDLLRDSRPPMVIIPDSRLAAVLGTRRLVDMYKLTELVSRHVTSRDG